MDEICFDASCPVHHRVDGKHISDTEIRIVTYIGEYAVITSTAPELQDPTIRVAQAIGFASFPRLVTAVCLVGSDAATLDSSLRTVGDGEFVRFFQRHDNVDDPETPHDMVVSEVRSGTIDLSKGISEEELAEDVNQYVKFPPGL